MTNAQWISPIQVLHPNDTLKDAIGKYQNYCRNRDSPPFYDNIVKIHALKLKKTKFWSLLKMEKD